MTAIAAASARRSLKEYEAVTVTYAHELQDDILIKHHLHFLNEPLCMCVHLRVRMFILGCAVNLV